MAAAEEPKMAKRPTDGQTDRQKDILRFVTESSAFLWAMGNGH